MKKVGRIKKSLILPVSYLFLTCIGLYIFPDWNIILLFMYTSPGFLILKPTQDLSIAQGSPNFIIHLIDGLFYYLINYFFLVIFDCFRDNKDRV